MLDSYKSSQQRLSYLRLCVVCSARRFNDMAGSTFKYVADNYAADDYAQACFLKLCAAAIPCLFALTRVFQWEENISKFLTTLQVRTRCMVRDRNAWRKDVQTSVLRSGMSCYASARQIGSPMKPQAKEFLKHTLSVSVPW